MRIIIFANGVMDDPAAESTRWLRPDDVVVAADGGTQHALVAGLTPAHIIGDLDSLSPALREQLTAAGTLFHAHPADKDETDLELALLWAAEQQAEQIIILGGFGGRLDQLLANIMLLTMPQLAGHEVKLVGAKEEAFVLNGGHTATIVGQVGDTVSLLPLNGDATEISTEGLKWQLHGETLRAGPARGVSNVIVSLPARVQLGTGHLLIIHRFDGV